MAVEHILRVGKVTGTGRQHRKDLSVNIPQDALDREFGLVSVLKEVITYDQFTDGGAAVGTYQMAGTIPAGAVLLGSKVLVDAGFAGDTSCTLTIGDGSDADRYMTGTPSIFATAAAGVETGVPSGNKLVTADNRPTLTATSGSDWGSVTAGQITVRLYYIEA